MLGGGKLIRQRGSNIKKVSPTNFLGFREVGGVIKEWRGSQECVCVCVFVCACVRSRCG